MRREGPAVCFPANQRSAVSAAVLGALTHRTLRTHAGYSGFCARTDDRQVGAAVKQLVRRLLLVRLERVRLIVGIPAKGKRAKGRARVRPATLSSGGRREVEETAAPKRIAREDATDSACTLRASDAQALPANGEASARFGLAAQAESPHYFLLGRSGPTPPPIGLGSALTDAERNRRHATDRCTAHVACCVERACCTLHGAHVSPSRRSHPSFCPNSPIFCPSIVHAITSASSEHCRTKQHVTSHMRADDSPATSAPGLWRIQEARQSATTRYRHADAGALTYDGFCCPQCPLCA